MQSPVAKVLSRVSSVSAGAFLLLVFLAVAVQIVARAFGILVPSADDVARYAMAIAAFHGLAYTYLDGAHIRVTLFFSRAEKRLAQAFTLVIAAVTLVVVGFLVFYWGEMAYESRIYGSRSSGLLSIPIWVIQFIALLGFVVFMLSVLIDIWSIVFRGRSEIDDGEPEVADTL